MKVLLLGAGGKIGNVILQELANRGHAVSAAYRKTPGQAEMPENADVLIADARDASAIARAATGHDAVVSAIGPGRLKSVSAIEEVASALITGLATANVFRLIIVGGAGTLELSPGVIRLDAPSYPEQFRASGLAQKAALELYEDCNLDWTYISPPIKIGPGEKRGRYRIGSKEVLYDESGESWISTQDYAVALCEVLEAGTHKRSRITVGY
jgi:uncharacterized protein